MARERRDYKKRGEVALNNFTPEGHLILLSISTAYTLLRASVSKTVEKGNPYKFFLIFLYNLLPAPKSLNIIRMDYTNSQSVPFESVDYDHGLKVAKGIFKLGKKGIELEYQVQDSLVGVFKSDVKTLLVPYEDLDSIQFKKGWFSAKIILQTSSLELLKELPGNEQGECTLKIKRNHRDEAQNTVSKARLALSEYRLDQLDDSSHE